jgi:hypothetical protein
LAGLWLGLAIGRMLPDRVLRIASVSMLVLIAISAIVTPILR